MEMLANQYADWSREELEDGIEEVKAKIEALEDEVAAKAEHKRQREVKKLKAGIADVKAKLRALGVGIPGPGRKKRKRELDDDGNAYVAPKKHKKGVRGRKKGGPKRDWW